MLRYLVTCSLKCSFANALRMHIIRSDIAYQISFIFSSGVTRHYLYIKYYVYSPPHAFNVNVWFKNMIYVHTNYIIYFKTFHTSWISVRFYLNKIIYIEAFSNLIRISQFQHQVNVVLKPNRSSCEINFSLYKFIQNSNKFI